MFVLLVFLLASSATSAPSASSQYCNNIGAKIPDPYDASKYYICVNYQWELQSCLVGYIYDQNTQSCVFGNAPPTVNPPTTKPPQICQIGETQKDIYDITKYWYCVDGYQWELVSCAPGLFFEDGRCQGVPTQAPPTTTTTRSQPPSGYCETGQLKADPEDCHKYYECDHGYWIHRVCGPGTAWSQHLLTCEYESRVCGYN